MTTLYYRHDDFLLHDTGRGHPECPARLRAIDQAVADKSFAGLRPMKAEIPADIRDRLALIHRPAMIERVLTSIPEHTYLHLDADTVASPGSSTAALRAVATACEAIDHVLSGKASNAFCALRPPGHHATPTQPMGFCLFNNIAIAAEFARRQYGLQRIAIVDFDVHHGNGTQAAFYRQPQVFYASSHQMPCYPGSGTVEETGVGNIVNQPLAPGSGGEAFRRAYQQKILPALGEYQPQLLLLSAGFDAHRDDPLAALNLLEEDYAWLTWRLLEIAERCCQGRIVSLLEGGYNLKALASSVAAHVGALVGEG